MFKALNSCTVRLGRQGWAGWLVGLFKAEPAPAKGPGPFHVNLVRSIAGRLSWQAIFARVRSKDLQFRTPFTLPRCRLPQRCSDLPCFHVGPALAWMFHTSLSV